jgi:hypothetical protein
MGNELGRPPFMNEHDKETGKSGFDQKQLQFVRDLFEKTAAGDAIDKMKLGKTFKISAPESETVLTLSNFVSCS